VILSSVEIATVTASLYVGAYMNFGTYSPQLLYEFGEIWYKISAYNADERL
jgi:hypothetical protein